MNITKIAIFSVGQFRCGVDAAQIQEIVMIPAERILKAIDVRCVIASMPAPQSLLPIFDIAAYLRVSPPGPTDVPPRSLLCVTFRWQKFLLACNVGSVETILPVTFASLQPVPRVIASIAARSRIWGFYPCQEQVIPLLDLEQFFHQRELQQILASIFPSA